MTERPLLELLRFTDFCFLTTPGEETTPAGEEDLLEVGDVFAEGDTDDLAADTDETPGRAPFPFPITTVSVVASLLALQPIFSEVYKVRLSLNSNALPTTMLMRSWGACHDDGMIDGVASTSCRVFYALSRARIR